jgi:S1-C subfamily serine protease
VISKEALYQLAKALDGLPVLGCLQGTPAFHAGVRYGDILISVNGMRTRSFEDYLQAKALRSDGMAVVLYRAGQEHPIELEYQASRRAVDPYELLAELAAMRILPGDVRGDDTPS